MNNLAILFVLNLLLTTAGLVFLISFFNRGKKSDEHPVVHIFWLIGGILVTIGVIGMMESIK